MSQLELYEKASELFLTTLTRNPVAVVANLNRYLEGNHFKLKLVAVENNPPQASLYSHLPCQEQMRIEEAWSCPEEMADA